jgi:glyoxylase-like metal-dependent hydrolase (beta-lactamase superfamily II)
MQSLSYPFAESPAAGTSLEIRPGIRWLRMPLPMALDHINLYLLEDSDGWWAVDTGMALGPTESLWRQVIADLGDKPIKAVLCTHMHPDHIGMAGWLCDQWQAPLYMTQAEYLSGRVYSTIDPDNFGWMHEQFYRRAGYDEAMIEQARARFAGFGSIIRQIPGSYHRLQHGDVLRINDVRWRVIVGRGHSPEHACLYSDALNILLSGDQVIPRITSNVSVSASEPEGNPLRDWFAAHERFIEELPEDCLVLPAHNEPFHGLHARSRYLIDHHEEQLLALEQACAERPQTALELLPVLFTRTLDEHQLGLALGECIAHLNYLHQRGQLAREADATGHWRYSSSDATLQHRLRQEAHKAAEIGPLQV